LADFLQPTAIAIVMAGKEADIMSLYPSYIAGSAISPQYTAAKEYFEHGGKILGLHKERDTNNGLRQLTNAIQSDMAQLKMELAQSRRGVSSGNVNPSSVGASPHRLYLNG
jgi:hypothetical protein